LHKESNLMKGKRIPLTEAIIAGASCPPDRQWRPLWDATQPGLMVRIYRTGNKSYWFRYRPPGAGRSVNPKWIRLGDVGSLSLKDARDAARIKAGEVAKGGDPAGSRRQQKRRDKARLEPALTLYGKNLADRNVVKRSEVLSLLQRELLTPLGNVDLADLNRVTLVRRIETVKESGRPGAAKELRTRAGVFLGWAVDQGLIPANPLAGWRQPRRTRAERIGQSGRALPDSELPGFWRAVESQGWPFGPYLQLLLLLGQRRTETALMSWSDIVLDGRAGTKIYADLPPQQNLWIVPPAITKSGRPHHIPLPRQAVAILKAMPRLARSDAVFPGRTGKPMTGWSKRLPDIYGVTVREGVGKWTPHDLRRTMRTGLGRLGVDRVIAELLMDHAISDELARIYDRGSYWQVRIEASQRWAEAATCGSTSARSRRSCRPGASTTGATRS
jgi:integrase